MDLRGRTVVLTGASGGIGRLLCGGLVGEGAQVVAVGRGHDRLQALTETLPTGAVIPVVADIGTGWAAARCWRKSMRYPGRPRCWS